MKRIVATALLLGATACAAAPEQERRVAPAPSCRATQPAGSDTVRWIVPEAHLPRLDAWCAAVGPALVRATAEAATAAPAQLDSLLVVTWNVHVGGGDLRAFVADLRSGVLTGGRPVRHFALLLQEAFRRSDELPDPVHGMEWPPSIGEHPPTGTRTPTEHTAAELGLNMVYVPSMRNGGSRARGEREDRGNAILSTLPLERPVALELPFERQRRVAVVATVRGRSSTGAAWELQLATAHLENRADEDIVGVRARSRQAQWLVAALPPAAAAVLGADLNTWVRGHREEAKEEVLPHFPETVRELPPGPTHQSFVFFRGRLDYLFARVPGGSMTDYVRAPDSYGSDHFPLLAWIHFPPGGPGDLSAR
jgi:endonuclease/exonuclease/phosphatase family metal-dependent hydrolase